MTAVSRTHRPCPPGWRGCRRGWPIKAAVTVKSETSCNKQTEGAVRSTWPGITFKLGGSQTKVTFNLSPVKRVGVNRRERVF